MDPDPLKPYTMTWRTNLEPVNLPFQINHQSTILSMGSCFADQIGSLLQEHKFSIHYNPFGVLFNPYSIADLIERSVEERDWRNENWQERAGMFYNFDLHSQMAAPTLVVALKRSNKERLELTNYLRKTDLLIITFGTAQVFQQVNNQKIVANCHKFDPKLFNQTWLTVENIVEKWKTVLTSLQKINPDIKTLFTVSPVRHTRMGLVDNQKSKSILRVAVDELVNINSNAYYFPSYEIMIDDLRDYRFYKKDLIHPNEMAIEYIWDYFSKAVFSEKTNNLIKVIQKIKTALNHRPRHANSAEYRRFLEQQKDKIIRIGKEQPQLSWKDELNFVNNFLNDKSD